MTTREGVGDGPTFWNGGSLFNTCGQRLNEIDLDNHEAPKTIADMTPEDWDRAVAALHEFDAERGLQR